MRMKKLVETVSKVPLPPHTKQLIVEVMASDDDGEDVEVSRFHMFISASTFTRLTDRFHF